MLTLNITIFPVQKGHFHSTRELERLLTSVDQGLETRPVQSAVDRVRKGARVWALLLIRAVRRNMHCKTTELIDFIGGQLVAEGVVEEVRNGNLSSLTVVNDLRRSTARIDFIDEFLAITVDGAPAASTPEIIIVVDRTTNRPLRCDEVTRGLSVVVATLPSIHEWPEDALSLVGPAAFG